MSLGITAMELFACNPYRVLGIAVNTPEEKIAETYKKLLSMAQRGSIRDYRTEFDFPDALPPFERTESSLRTAFAKLASNGYRCFAYSDGQFSAALNIDDVMLNLRDITCYDCFLRCYMWLITNDRNFEEPELWISLCKYIDKMIMSSPNEWHKYFDNRFPERMIDASMTVYKSFYATFCELILLPIKELARGSMKCKNAMDILRIAGVDINEEFEYIEIPQANLPKPGEPAPLLKIAAKNGDEYFDVRTGKMTSFSSESNAVESNQFAAASTSISADAIVSDEEPTDLKLPRAKVLGEFENKKPSESTAAVNIAEPQVRTEEPPIAVTKPEPPKVNISKPQPRVSESVYVQSEPVAPVDEKPKFNFTKPAEPTPEPPIQPVQPKSVVKSADSSQEQASVKHVEEIIAPKRRNKIVIPNQSNTESVQHFAGAGIQNDGPIKPFDPLKSNLSENSDVSDSSAKKPFKRSAKKLTSLVEQTDDFMNDSISLTEDADDENDYTKALIEMHRANRSTHQMMKDVDTKHVYDNGDSLGSPDDAKLSMDAINMKNYDKARLGYTISPDENDPKKLRDEKYKNINIGDMLNPTLGLRTTQRTYEPDAIMEYKSEKVKSKKVRKTLFRAALFLGAAIVIYVLLFFMGIL